MVELKQTAFSERMDQIFKTGADFAKAFRLAGEVGDKVLEKLGEGSTVFGAIREAINETQASRREIITKLTTVHGELDKQNKDTLTSLEKLSPSLVSISEKLESMLKEAASEKGNNSETAQSLSELKTSVDAIIALIRTDHSKEINENLVKLGKASEEISNKVGELLSHFGDDPETASITRIVDFLIQTLEVVKDMKDELGTNAENTQKILESVEGLTDKIRDETKKPDDKLASLLKKLEDEAEKTKGIHASLGTIESRLATIDRTIQELNTTVVAVIREEVRGISKGIIDEAGVGIATGLQVSFASFQATVDKRLGDIERALKSIAAKLDGSNERDNLNGDGNEELEAIELEAIKDALTDITARSGDSDKRDENPGNGIIPVGTVPVKKVADTKPQTSYQAMSAHLSKITQNFTAMKDNLFDLRFLCKNPSLIDDSISETRGLLIAARGFNDQAINNQLTKISDAFLSVSGKLRISDDSTEEERQYLQTAKRQIFTLIADISIYLKNTKYNSEQHI